MHPHALSSLCKAFPASESRGIEDIDLLRQKLVNGRVTAMNVQPISNGSSLLTKPGRSWCYYKLGFVEGEI